MNVLAFDTATAACSVAIRRRDGALFDHRPATARMFEQPAHATDLLPAIVELLERAEMDWSDLDRIAVGVGPGAFTGLRIGVASARAIATARSLPLTPVSSLAALAAGAGAGDTAEVLPVIDARRGEFFYRLPAGANGAAGDAVSGPEELFERVAALAGDADTPPLAVGDGAVKLRDRLAATGAAVPEAGDPRHVVSAAAIIALADALESFAPDEVVPNYIRAPDAKISSRERWLVKTTQ